jgi:RimJ/RimL family protein N-acetyltransferase
MDTLSLARFDRTLTLPGGKRLRVRPIRPEDERGLADLYDRSSFQTRYQRFFTVMRRLPPDTARFLANVDYERRFALVVEDLTAPATSLVGVARYEPSEPGVAEIAVVVEDPWQRKGLGSLLINELFRAGAENGVARFRAWVLADNHRMLGLLARHAQVLERTIDDGVIGLLVAPGVHRPRTVNTAAVSGRDDAAGDRAEEKRAAEA